MPITNIALLLSHGMLYKKLVASVTKMLDHYNHNRHNMADGKRDTTNLTTKVARLDAQVNRDGKSHNR